MEQVKRAEDVQALLEYLSAPSRDATLVLVAGGFASEVDRKIVGAIPKERQKIFWEMFDNQKQGWVVSYFRQRKITIDPTAVEYILDMVENNTRDMRTECERLALFFGAGAAIGLADVEQYIYHSKEENVFTLFDRLCERELSGSLEVLDKILLSREAEATQITSGLLMQFRRLASLKRMQAENYEASEAFPGCGSSARETRRRTWKGRGSSPRLIWTPSGFSWRPSTSASAPSGATCTSSFSICWCTISFREPGKEHGGSLSREARLLLDVVHRGPQDRLHGAEDLHQPPAPGLTDAGHAFQKSQGHALRPLLLVERRGKPVGLVAHRLQDPKGRRGLVQQKGVVPAGQEDLLLLLGKPDDGDLLQAQASKDSAGRAELAFPSVDQDQVGPVQLLVQHPRVAAGNRLADRFEVVDLPVEAADGERAVELPVRPAVGEAHHGGDGVGALQVRDVESLDAAGESGQAQVELQPFQRRGHLRSARRLGRLLAGVRLRHGQELRMLAALRNLHRDLPAAKLAQELREVLRVHGPRPT